MIGRLSILAEGQPMDRFIPNQAWAMRSLMLVLLVGLSACIDPTKPVPCAGAPGQVLVPGAWPAENFSATQDTSTIQLAGACVLNAQKAAGFADYKITVARAGRYDLRLTLNAPVDNAQLSFALNGQSLNTAASQPLQISTLATGATSFAVFLAPEILLPAGDQVLRINFDTAGVGSGTIANLDSLELVATTTHTGTFNGEIPIPGVLEAEHFDWGSNGMEYNIAAFKINNPAPRLYRVSDVPLEPNGTGGYAIANTQVGEWLSYSVVVAKTDSFVPRLTHQADTAGGRVSLWVDGSKLATSRSWLEATGTTFKAVDFNPVKLSKGKHIMRLGFEQIGVGASSVASIDKLEFLPPQNINTEANEAFPNGVAWAIPGTIQAEDYDKGGNGIGYFKQTDIYNPSGAYRPNDAVDIANQSGVVHVTGIQAREWLLYSINVPQNLQGKRLQFNMVYASPDGGGRYSLSLDGAPFARSLPVKQTGGWQNFVMQKAVISTLSPGKHRLRIQFDALGANLGSVMNFDRLEIVPAPDPTPPPDPVTSTVGKWSDLIPFAVLPIHAALLPDGKVLSWGGGDDYDLGINAEVWTPNPAQTPAQGMGVHTKQFYAPSNLFCAGFSFLPDGRLLLAGAHYDAERGMPDANIFDYKNFDPASTTLNAMTPTTPMYSQRNPNPGVPAGSDALNPNKPNFKPDAYYQDPSHVGRWYPSTTMLSNGEIMVTEGYAINTAVNDMPEVYQTSSSNWRQLSNARITDDRAISYYPFMYANINNEMVRVGPEPTMYVFNPSNTGSVRKLASPRDQTGRDYGSAVMYRPGKVLVVGGGDPPVETAVTVDLSTDPPTVVSTGSMQFKRRQFNATLMPDGRVLIAGGTSLEGHNDESGFVYNAEIWDPNTGQFSLAAPLAYSAGLLNKTKGRAYHSVGLLMPDARVLLAGGGGCSTCVYNNQDAQLYSPSYLLDASNNPKTRPTISSLTDANGLPSTNFTYGSILKISSSVGINRVTLLKLGAVTHTRNFDQNFIEATAVTGGINSTWTLPSGTGSDAWQTRKQWFTPGHYLLFALDANGTPSEAKIIKIQ